MTFQNKKINRYELQPHVEVDSEKLHADFDVIDGYFDEIKEYIYTDVVMTDHTQPIEIAFQSRLQILMSSTLNRSLLLKDGVVQALNDSNFPSFYAILKSLMDIMGLLGYLAYTIHHKDDYQEIIEVINRLSLGNRDSGVFERGTVEAVNVLTMLEKADKMFMMGIESDQEIVSKTPLADTYGDVCNYGHPNYNAHLSSGMLDQNNKWKAKTNSEGYKTELYAFYMPALTITIGSVVVFCSIIVRDLKVKGFEGLDSSHLF